MKKSPCTLMKQSTAARKVLLKGMRAGLEFGYTTCKVGEKIRNDTIQKGKQSSVNIPPCKVGESIGTMHNHPNRARATLSIQDQIHALYRHYICAYAHPGGEGRCLSPNKEKMAQADIQAKLTEALALENTNDRTDAEWDKLIEYYRTLPFLLGQVCSWGYTQKTRREKEPASMIEFMVGPGDTLPERTRPKASLSGVSKRKVRK